jgi:hypothetical protein
MLQYPTKKLFGKTWVGWLNFLLLQWFCIRLEGTVNSDRSETEWNIIKWITPLTGWWSDYRYLNDD